MSHIRIVRYGLLIFCCLLYASVVNSSENAHFKQLLNEQNLSSTYVNHIIQRHDGFIWIATAEGISRFDGKNYINHNSYPKDLNSLPNPWVNQLLEDHNNQLWVATAIGLARMLPDEVNFKQYKFSPVDKSTLSGNKVVFMFEDSNHRIWLATDRGLSLYQPGSDDFNNFYIDDDINNIEVNNINTIAQKSPQQLWVGTDYGLFIFDIQTTEFTHYSLNPDESTPYEVLDIETDGKGHLWIVTAYNGLIKLTVDGGETTTYNHQNDNPNSIVSDALWNVMIDDNDNAWITSWGEGVSQVSAEDGSIKRYRHNLGDSNSIPSNLTTDVFQDNNGVIWVSTYDGIALHDPNNAIENIRPTPGNNNSLSSDLVWVFEETDDAIWIGTTEGLNRLDKKTNEIQRFHSSNGQNGLSELISIWSMAQVDENNFWLGTEYGLARFSIQSEKLEYLYELTPTQTHTVSTTDVLNNPVWSIAINSDLSVWVGSNMANLYLVDKNMNLIKDYSALIQSTLAQYDNVEFTDITVDDNDNLWLSTASGLFFFDVTDVTVSPVRSSQGEILFEEDWIYAVEKHWDNQYWVSSQYSGVSLFSLNDSGTMEKELHFDYAYPNIEDRGIFTVIATNENEAWFTGKRTLYQLDLNTRVVTNYGHSYFESDLNFHENSQFFTADKMLYLGSNRGVIRFDPKQIKKSDFQPKVYITTIKSNNKSIITSLADPYLEAFSENNLKVESDTPVHKMSQHVFDYDDTIFSFQFAALDYINADDLHYAYRIPELDSRWVELLNKNELTLTNLDAGDYRLEVKATNADLQWSEHTATLAITLLPKPWLTWWAKLLYAMAVLLITTVIVRLYRSRLLTQYALKHREVQLSQAIWGSGDELWEWDIPNQEIVRTNSAELDDNRHRFFNGSFKTNSLNIHPDDIDQLEQKIANIMSGTSDEFDAVYRQKNNEGIWLWMQDRAKVTVWSKNNSPLRVNGISRNINTIKKKEQKSQLIASAFQSSSDGALVLDADLKIISINAAFTEITGYDSRIINRHMKQDSASISTDEMKSPALFQHILSGIEKGGSFRNEINILNTKGKSLPVDLRVNCIYNAQKAPSHYIATLTDITYRKDTEEVLKRLANYDSLTGLPNRSLMMIQLNQALHLAETNEKHMAIMFVDLDHFKNINDSLGHTIGDELLIAVAQRLTECISKTDTIARIGGDEFTIGILRYETAEDVIEVAEKIIVKMSKPFQLENHELIITPSIGIATYNDTRTDIETLLMQADTAMYHAKKKGRNNYRFFTESMNEAVLQRVDIEMRLRKALENEELVLNYQPKYNLTTGQVSGFEALLRWQDADQILTPPDEFIPIAEETGLIFSIGEFVLESACQELNRWHANGFKDISIAINLSAVQFMDKKLAWRVSQVLKKYNIEPLRLEMEITESTLIENLQYAIKTLQELRKLGIKLSLDDFGTGFSSLSYLKQFPIHALKIDRTFILDMVNDSRDASMVESIISLAHKLSIEVIAEGVETTEQLTMLKSYEIEEVQGYLLSKPVDSEKVMEILNQDESVATILSQF